MTSIIEGYEYDIFNNILCSLLCGLCCKYLRICVKEHRYGAQGIESRDKEAKRLREMAVWN